MSELAVIVNPASGGGRTGRGWEAFAARLRSAGVDFDVFLTSRPQEATEIARREVKASRPLLVAAGGDGTLNEVVNGFFERTEAIPTATCLGMIPFGSGGDFRRTFHLPRSVEGVVSLLSERHTVAIDVGRATLESDGGRLVRHFINIADAGIGGEVVARVNRSSKPLGGTVAFLTASLAGLTAWKNTPMRITGDGRTRDLICQQVVIANGRYYGGGMMVAPRAIPDDGLLDVLVVGDLSLAESLRGLGRIRSGRHLDRQDPKLEFFRAAELEVSADTPVPVDLDGEDPGHLPMRVEVVPQALRLVVPEAAR